MFDSYVEARPIRRVRTKIKKLRVEETLASLQQPVNEVVRPCLAGLVYLSADSRKMPPDVAYTHVRKLLVQTKAKLQGLGLRAEDAEDIHYALVAFADEVMQQQSPAMTEFWRAHLLQLELYGETRAGEGFFNRLQKAKDENRLAALRVFQLCLLFGFYGIYGEHGELERENLVEELRSALGEEKGRQITLAPHGGRPDEPTLDRVRNRLLLWLGAVAALGAVAWYVGIAFTLNAQANLLQEAVHQAARDLEVGLTNDSASDRADE